MKVELKFEDVEALRRELDNLLNQKVPFLVKHKIRKNLTILNPLADSIVKDRTDIIIKFGVEDKKAGTFTLVDSPNKAEGIKALIEYLTAIEKLTLETFPKDSFDKVEDEFPYKVVYELLEKK